VHVSNDGSPDKSLTASPNLVVSEQAQRWARPSAVADGQVIRAGENQDEILKIAKLAIQIRAAPCALS